MNPRTGTWGVIDNRTEARSREKPVKGTKKVMTCTYSARGGEASKADAGISPITESDGKIGGESGKGRSRRGGGEGGGEREWGV